MMVDRRAVDDEIRSHRVQLDQTEGEIRRITGADDGTLDPSRFGALPDLDDRATALRQRIAWLMVDPENTICALWSLPDIEVSAND